MRSKLTHSWLGITSDMLHNRVVRDLISLLCHIWLILGWYASDSGLFNHLLVYFWEHSLLLLVQVFLEFLELPLFLMLRLELGVGLKLLDLSIFLL